MMKKITFILGALALSSKADIASDMLDAHNTVRGSLGIPDLSWSNDLQQSAQNYAEKLAASGSLVHSHTSGQGENLASGSAGSYTPDRLFQLWINEEQNFIPGRNYPDCQTGNGKVGHYTQVVWENTQEVGCGFYVGSKAVLVCQYRPPGNVRGHPVYSGNGASTHSNNNNNYNNNNGDSSNNGGDNQDSGYDNNNNNNYNNGDNQDNGDDNNNNNYYNSDNSNNGGDNQDNGYNNYNNNNNYNNGGDNQDNGYNNNNNYNNNNDNYNNNGGGGSQGGQGGSNNGGGRNGGGGGSQGGQNGGGGGR